MKKASKSFDYDYDYNDDLFEAKERYRSEDHSKEYASKAAYYARELSYQRNRLIRATEKVATVTGRALGFWKQELRRAEAGVPRCINNLKQYAGFLAIYEKYREASKKYLAMCEEV